MPFAEVLFGFQHFDSALTNDQNSAILFVGGGFDYKVTPRFSIRPFQADFVATRFNQALPPGISDVFKGVRPRPVWS